MSRDYRWKDQGRRLKEARRARELSIDELATKVASTVGTLRHIESGRDRGGEPLMLRVAGALGVPLPVLRGYAEIEAQDVIQALQRAIPLLDREQRETLVSMDPLDWGTMVDLWDAHLARKRRSHR